MSSNNNQLNIINNNKTTPLFNFQIKTEETNNHINPFLNCQDGFNMGSNSTSNGFSLGIKTNNNNSNISGFSLFSDNRPRKKQGFYN